jgi:hypothetical protein
LLLFAEFRLRAPAATNEGIAMLLDRPLALALLFAFGGLSGAADAQGVEPSNATAAWLKKLPAIRPIEPFGNVNLPTGSCDFQTVSLPQRPVCNVEVEVSLATSLPGGAVVCTAEIRGVLRVPAGKRNVNVVWTIKPVTAPPPPTGHSFQFAPDHGVLIIDDLHEQIRPRLGGGGSGTGGRGDGDGSPNDPQKFFWRNKNIRPGTVAIEPITYMPAVLWTRPPTATEPAITELCRAIDPKIVNDG